MQTTYNLFIDLKHPYMLPPPTATINDNNSRFLNVCITDERKTVEVLDDDTALFLVKRPDGESRVFNATIENGKVIAELNSWSLAKTGTITCNISILNVAAASRLTTQPFPFVVCQASCTDTDISEDPNYDLLTSLLQHLQETGSAYVLPTMSTTIKGGAKVGSGLTIDDDTLNVDTVNTVEQGDARPITSDAVFSMAEDIAPEALSNLEIQALLNNFV